MGRTILVSKRFNPGHFSHVVANYKLLSEMNKPVSLYLEPGFRGMVEELDFDATITYTDNAVAWKEVEWLIVWFPSIAVMLDILRLRLLNKTRIVYVYHEPFESLSSYLSAGFGLSKTIKICLTSMVNYLSARLSHGLMLPSNKAYATVSGWRLAKKKKIVNLPLMFDDEYTAEAYGHLKKEYFSYIGTIADDHAFDEYINFMLRAVADERMCSVRFMIATKSHIEKALLQRLHHLVVEGRLVLQYGVPLTNKEINTCYSRSFCVWNAYRRSMQSGVLPKSYMFGSPVLVTACNTNEFSQNGVTAAIVSERYDFNEMVSAVMNLFKEINIYSSNCRKFFLKTFYYKAQRNIFSGFLAELER